MNLKQAFANKLLDRFEMMTLAEKLADLNQHGKHISSFDDIDFHDGQFVFSNLVDVALEKFEEMLEENGTIRLWIQEKQLKNTEKDATKLAEKMIEQVAEKIDEESEIIENEIKSATVLDNEIDVSVKKSHGKLTVYADGKEYCMEIDKCTNRLRRWQIYGDIISD